MAPNQTSYKAVALAQSLASTLNQRLNGTLTFKVNVDTDGAPYLSAGSGTAGAENVVIKAINYLQLQDKLATTATAPSPYTDSLGLNPSLYSPTTLQVVTEAYASSTFGNGTNATGTITISSGAGATSSVIAGTTDTVTWTTSDNNTASLLAAAINADVKVNKLVHAIASTNTVVVTALPGLGAAGNSIGFTATGTGVTASGSGFLAGGVSTNTGATLSLVKLADLGKILGDVFNDGTIVELYLSAAGTAPTPGGGTLVATYTTSLQYPGMSNN